MHLFPSLAALSAVAVAVATLAGQAVARPASYSSSSHRDCIRSYTDCNTRFRTAKWECGRRFGRSGDRHGRCIDDAVGYFDKCIVAVDNDRSFCWDREDEDEYDDDSNDDDKDDDKDEYDSYSGHPSATFAAARESWWRLDRPREHNRPRPRPPAVQRRAIVNIRPDPTQPAGASISGTVAFVQNSPTSKIQVIADLAGIPPGKHGWHVHVSGNIFPNCTAAGLHFNPFNVNHGAPNARTRHVGDFGNMDVGADGRFQQRFTDRLASLFGERSIIGRALVIHANQDDLGLTNNPLSKVVGNSGGRLACGVVGLIDA